MNPTNTGDTSEKPAMKSSPRPPAMPLDLTAFSIASGGPGLEREWKELQKPIEARPYPIPPEDLFHRLAAISRTPMNLDLPKEARTLCNIADDYIRARGLDDFTECIYKILLSTIGKHIMLVSIRADLENNRLGTKPTDEPVARVNRDENLPLLEQLSGLFMKIERERCSILHIRNLAARKTKAPTAPAPSSTAELLIKPEAKQANAATA